MGRLERGLSASFVRRRRGRSGGSVNESSLPASHRLGHHRTTSVQAPGDIINRLADAFGFELPSREVWHTAPKFYSRAGINGRRRTSIAIFTADSGCNLQVPTPENGMGFRL